MKRILTIFAVVLAMTAMMLVTAMPAFATHKGADHGAQRDPTPPPEETECEVGDINAGPADICVINQ
jgi:hypothetical protein